MTTQANFSFSTVPHVICENAAAQRLGALTRQFFADAQRVLLVTDHGFLTTGLVEQPATSLEASGFAVHVYADVVADPPEAVVLAAVEAARAFGADLIIGIGGGSSMDVAKLIAVLAPGGQEIGAIYGIGNVRGKRLPLMQIPTTAGTGSEVTNIAIVSTGAHTKMGVVAPQLYADVAVLDAGLTLGLPARISAATGIDAMVHAIEAYTSVHKKNVQSDLCAREALRLLSANLLPTCRNGADLGARQAMLFGAMLAGQAFSNSPVAAVHALAYPIGGTYHVPHGLSNALVLPHVLRFNLPDAAHWYAELAGIVAPEATGSEEARALALIAALEGLIAAAGIERTLRQVGIAEADLDQLATDAMLQTRLLQNNPRPLVWQDARDIYAAAL
ncbi:iron-containing alcohol dehydrogenase [Duganella sp. BuS-21]|uniref:iron-containing alcohol dehydrogenase n=1 Tax=Duganella sp. BuS-21 TaxID=2943848 RepID=UPI0035A5EBBF